MQQVAITITNQFVVNNKTQEVALNLLVEATKNKDHWFTGTDRISWFADVESVKSIKDCWVSCVTKDATIRSFLDGYTQRLSGFSGINLKVLLLELYKTSVFHCSSKVSHKIEFSDKEFNDKIEFNDTEITFEITLTINTTLTKE
jgi:hypothetical protein